MATYAQGTAVSSDSSLSEIKRTLQRYGADQFMHMEDTREGYAMIAFRIGTRQVKMMLPLPDPQSKEFTHTPARGFARAPKEAQAAWEQSCRQRWRALALIVKAKLEAVQSGISTIDREFLADILLPDGRTFHEWAEPQIERIYLTGHMPPLLPSLPAGPEVRE